MIKIQRSLLVPLFAALHCGLIAQCLPTIYTLGDPNAISTGPSTTPFPTALGRGARVQYLISAQMLSDQGVCPGVNITGISLDLLDNDSPGTLTTIWVRAKNFATTQTCDYDDPGFLQVVQDYEVHLDSGTLVIPFTTSPWQWAGAPFNFGLDISILRNNVPGINPRVVIDTNYVNPIGEYGYGDGNGSMPGWDYQFRYQDSTTFGCVHYLPVFGLYQAIAMGVDHTPSLGVSDGIFPNPASESITIRSNALRSEPGSIHIMDETGRVVLHMSLTTGQGTSSDVPISLEGLSPGIYQVVQIMDNGGVHVIGPLSVY